MFSDTYRLSIAACKDSRCVALHYLAKYKKWLEDFQKKDLYFVFIGPSNVTDVLVVGMDGPSTWWIVEEIAEQVSC